MNILNILANKKLQQMQRSYKTFNNFLVGNNLDTYVNPISPGVLDPGNT